MAAPPVVPEVEVKNFESRLFGTLRLPDATATLSEKAKEVDSKNGGAYAPIIRDVWPIAKSLLAVSNKYGVTFVANAEIGTYARTCSMDRRSLITN
jgi:hypothetical protein